MQCGHTGAHGNKQETEMGTNVRDERTVDLMTPLLYFTNFPVKLLSFQLADR